MGSMTRSFVVALLVGGATTLSACGSAAEAPGAAAAPPSRSFRMGFSLDSPPLPSVDRALQRFDLWARRADASITHADVPWARLLAGEDAAALVRSSLGDPVIFMRARGLAIVITLEPLNGLDRTTEAPALAAAGRSLTEPAVQRLYRAYALEAARQLRPDYLGLAAEVNMFQAYGPAPVYEALVGAVADAAADIRAAGLRPPLYVSLQVDTAWGRDGNGGPYRGAKRTVADFPAIDVLGLSTYPLLGWETPESIPDDYFARLRDEARLPGLVSESGWPSTFSRKTTSPEMQARWIRTLERLADRAELRFVGQLLFSDFDATISAPPGSLLEYFASQGLVDRGFNPKPALSEWDRVFARPLR